ncbi:MAG TPA: DUF1800 domain-containing protein [Ideonella sp.]|jgi:uncharacterized protein (DUF1800 family)|nr:DUF1800 domain-containing protein [Ideonella sp.]
MHHLFSFVRRQRAPLAVLLASFLLAACGDSGGDATSETADSVHSAAGSNSAAQTGRTRAQGTGANTDASHAYRALAGTTRADAFRLLTQGTFGPVEADISHVMSIGAAGWVDEQLAKPANAVHLPRWLADDAAVKAKNPRDTAGAPSVVSSFYQQALQADDQLRQRTAYALSQIFVVSLADLASERSPSVASYQDMLTADAFGNFRTLLQDVAMHPAMGQYLSHIKNKKEDLVLGRVPDQNFAREVMQLFSIGLQQLNTDGSLKLDGNGAPIETYSTADIEGLSSVFTGFSWYGPDTLNARFFGTLQDPDRLVRPMQGYPQFHSTLEKRFLGTVVAPQSPADPAASLKAAIDTIYAHPNVGPFISRRLIQRLVTSAPTPAYVGRVAAVFNDNGQGVRGDLKAVVRAILLDDEARSPYAAEDPKFGKLREPVLRLTAFLRAFGVKSDSGAVLMTMTDDPGLTLAQTPLRSPSVFNFYRPGYVPPGGELASLGITAPEMQITDETSVAGYANYMLTVVRIGVGQKGIDGKAPRPDLQLDYTALKPLVTDPAQLVDTVNWRLFGELVSPAVRDELIAAVTSIPIPPLNKNGSNQAQIDKAKANRLWTAVALPLVTPEFIVQK